MPDDSKQQGFFARWSSLKQAASAVPPAQSSPSSLRSACTASSPSSPSTATNPGTASVRRTAASTTASTAMSISLDVGPGASSTASNVASSTAKLASNGATADLAAASTVSSTARRAAPTLTDIASLGPDSDYTAFMATGVDKTIRRLALQKLFADPHFNLMDGLDIYIGNYALPDPIAPAMLASLAQAKAFLQLPEDTEDKASQVAKIAGCDSTACHRADNAHAPINAVAQKAQADAEVDAVENAKSSAPSTDATC
jgi:hypothetical protein